MVGTDTAAVVDDALPVASHLLGDDAREVLAAGIAAVGGTLVDSDRSQVLYRPGRSITVRFDATVRWRDGVATPETLLAGADTDGAPAGTLPLRAGELEVGLWRYPFDPVLVGLTDAVTPSTVQQLVGATTGDLRELKLRSYRPGRRAVVQATGARGEVYVKVLPPGRAVADLVERHRRVATAAVPVPAVIVADEARGLVVLQSLGGESLRDRLRCGRGPWPGRDAFDDLIGRFAAVASLGRAAARPAPLVAVTQHAQLLARVLPVMRPVIDELLGRIHASASGRDAVRCTIHGDLHEAQLLVDGTGVVGVLDLDDVGDGDPLDDWANHLGHVSALGGDAEQHAFALWRQRGPIAGRVAEPADLARRAAAVVLGLATGPFRVQERAWPARTAERLALVARWLDAGERAP